MSVQNHFFEAINRKIIQQIVKFDIKNGTIYDMHNVS